MGLLLAVGLKTFVVQSFYVPSGSMMPTLVGSIEDPTITDDRILVQKVSYWGGDVERGDVVVFEDPGGWLPEADEPTGFASVLSRVGLAPAGGHLVKRVVGVGGDEVQYCPGSSLVRVNGELADEPYVPGDPARPRSGSTGCPTVEVPEGSLWVMGDNRGDSEDSRAHVDDETGGAVEADLVVGKVWSIVWPADRFGGLGADGDLRDLP